jgi:hypothetical protein
MLDADSKLLAISLEFSRILFRSAFEILGEDDLNWVLCKTKLPNPITNGLSCEQVYSLERILNEFFGLLSAQGLSLRIGRIAFQTMRREFEEIKNLGMIDNRLKPLPKRLHYSFVVLGKTLNKHLGVQMVTKESIKGWRVKTKMKMKNDISINLRTYFIKGLIQEFLEWLDARKDFRIEDSVENIYGNISCEYSIQVLNVD